MKKILLLFVVMSCSITYLIHSMCSKLDEEQNMYKAKIGNQFILEKDTLIIVDYSTIKESFTLSNGKEVNALLVLKK